MTGDCCLCQVHGITNTDVKISPNHPQPHPCGGCESISIVRSLTKEKAVGMVNYQVAIASQEEP
jgi:hypothetical protein